ncbi:MAG: FlgD immunoglobulin-like domain containing protein [Candidatus Cloacimonetes bacterium]|nr:T9SS type A sorting domain-containing protein [Candidatus Cloacimonadota bacterium]MDD4223918.1 FlgD immunoglobulin-like domain containing protein [Candidatus Cloacimonadota bacterium]
MKNAVLIILLLGFIITLPASLVWDDAVPIRQGVNIEWFRTGTQTADGGAIYVWSDTKLGERDLWAQKVDAAGNMVWGDPVLIDGKPDRQEDPVITRTSDNNFIIAWIDFSDDLDGNVYAQKIDPNGQLLWPEGGKPVCTAVEVQIALNMEADSAGGAFIIWSDSRNPSKDLYGQRLDASGNPVWAVNGIPIANGTGDEEQNTMLPDGQGGMMIAYTHNYVGAEDIYLKRFNADGTMAWPQMVVLSDATGNQGKVRMATLTGGEFVFTWQDQRDDDPDIYAQKVNLSGQLLWADPFVVYGDSGTPGFAPQLNPRIVATSDNAAIIIWEDYRFSNQYPDLFAQKVAADASLLWSASGVALSVAEFAQIGPRMDSDGNGGCYVVWDDLRNGNSPNEDIYAQHLSASGAALWEANGRPVCSAPNQQISGLVKVTNNNVFINWMDLRNGSVGIYFQIYNQTGAAQLENNGEVVFWGLSGDTPLDNYLILPRANDTVILWQDTRFANLGYQIYFQFLNPDGSIGLEPNGRPVTLSTGYNQLTPSAVVTPDGHVAVAWEDNRNPDPKIYVQLLDPSGNRLWGDTGMELTEMDPLSQKDPRVSYLDGSFYIGWSNYDQVGSSYRYHVYGQRIQNNQKQWGPDGVMVSTLSGADLNSECVITDLKENYYSWQRFNPADFTQSVYVKRVGTDGNAATGWPEAGQLASTHSNYDTSQRFPLSTRTDQGIFVMWQDGRDDFIQNYYGQHLSASGERLWDDLGVDLADYGREQEKPTLVNKDGFRNEIVFAWCENINGYHDIIAQKYSLAGSPLWGDLGTFVVQKDSTQSNPTIARFDNGGMVIAWTDFFGIESDIYHKYIRPDGTFVQNSPFGDVVSNAGKMQYNPQIVTIGNEAYALWADGRSSGKTEILGLYAQRLSNETVANLDPALPAPEPFKLLQNHPNPFNPSTSISFTISDPARAYALEIFNTRGQKVKTLASGFLAKGSHIAVWDGTDDNGRGVSSGIYHYRLSNGSQSQSKRMVLIK